MPIFIVQGRYSRDAVKGMLAKPEDRAQVVARGEVDALGRERAENDAYEGDCYAGRLDAGRRIAAGEGGVSGFARECFGG